MKVLVSVLVELDVKVGHIHGHSSRLADGEQVVFEYAGDAVKKGMEECAQPILSYVDEYQPGLTIQRGTVRSVVPVGRL